MKSLDDLLLYIEKGVPDGHEYVCIIRIYCVRNSKMLPMSTLTLDQGMWLLKLKLSPIQPLKEKKII